MGRKLDTTLCRNQTYELVKYKEPFNHPVLKQDERQECCHRDMNKTIFYWLWYFLRDYFLTLWGILIKLFPSVYENFPFFFLQWTMNRVFKQYGIICYQWMYRILMINILYKFYKVICIKTNIHITVIWIHCNCDMLAYTNFWEQTSSNNSCNLWDTFPK